MRERGMTAKPSASLDLGIQLSDLWSAERCGWHVDFDESAGAEYPWTVVLEWVQEYGNQHQADWVTYTWLFYAESVEQALLDAVEWCEALVPFEQCGACDGHGEYNRTATEVMTCEECGGTGLAHNPAPWSSAATTRTPTP